MLKVLIFSIPIGAYSLRHVSSPVHCSPADSVLLHHDIKSKLSVGMHWGTFVMTDEPVNQPPQKLKEALAARSAGGERNEAGEQHRGERPEARSDG